MPVKKVKDPLNPGAPKYAWPAVCSVRYLCIILARVSKCYGKARLFTTELLLRNKTLTEKDLMEHIPGE